MGLTLATITQKNDRSGLPRPRRLNRLEQVERRICDSQELGGRHFKGTGFRLVREVNGGAFEPLTSKFFSEFKIKHVAPSVRQFLEHDTECQHTRSTLPYSW